MIFFLINDITLVKDTSSRAVYQAERKGESLWSVLMENKLIVLYILAVSGYYAVYQMYNFLMPLDLSLIRLYHQCKLYKCCYIYTVNYQNVF